MLEKPDFPDERIAAILREQYGITAFEVEFLPLGYDYAASVYRISAASGTYFLKLKQGVVDPAALRIPHWLRTRGIEQVIAPLLTLNGELSVVADEYTLILYPFVDGATAMERGMTEAQWIEFGAVLRRIHATSVTAEMAKLVERETWSARGGRERLRRLLAHADGLDGGDPIAAEMASVWREQRDAITRLVDRADALAEQVQARALDFVLCHSDIHVANVLIGNDGRLFIVDWDQPLLAPRERDLMFIVGSAGVVAVSADDQARFLRGYGDAEIDPVAFAYYRYDWVVQDVGEFGLSGFGFQGGSDDTRRDAIQWVRAILGPGDALDAALLADPSF